MLPGFLYGLVLLLALLGIIDADKWATVALFAVTAAANLFVPVYGIVAPWPWSKRRKTEGGKLVFGLVAAIAVVLDYVLAAVVFGEFIGRDLFRLAAYGSLFVVMAWGIIVLWQAQRASGRHFLRRNSDERARKMDQSR